MTLQIFPEYLKECNQIIFKLIYSNSVQLKQKQGVMLHFFLRREKLILFKSSQKSYLSRSENRICSESTCLFHQLHYQHLLEAAKGIGPLGAAKVFHWSDLFVIPLFGLLPFSLRVSGALQRVGFKVNWWVYRISLWRSHRLVWLASWVEMSHLALAPFKID